MAPVAELLAAIDARQQELSGEMVEHALEMERLEADIATKRGDKSESAQSEVRELLKKKESLQQGSRTLQGAIEVLANAAAKAKRASELGVVSWASVHEGKISISTFVRERLQENPDILNGLRRECGGGELTFKDGVLRFAGDKAILPALQEALSRIESAFEAFVACDDAETLRFLDTRGEFKRIATKHSVEVTVESGAGVRVSGVVQGAQKAEDAIRGLLKGSYDIDLPKNLFQAAKVKARDAEAETGAIIEICRSGGWAGAGRICLRGEEFCVNDAQEVMQAWLDDKEGCTSDWISAGSEITEWPPATLQEFRGDLDHLGSKFGVIVKDTSAPGELEVRGPPDNVSAAGKELQMILDFYKKAQKDAQAKAKAKPAKAKAKPKAVAKQGPENEDDGWGSAPVAEPPPGTW